MKIAQLTHALVAASDLIQGGECKQHESYGVSPEETRSVCREWRSQYELKE